ncbi:hypothetical protein [Variovorax sp.]|jgi:hypothetical protein|uniref:hypothetical protein n=1 Tax=Variovorax sp. TaxID=1871043 RepID=UPI001212A317|nr:hypothetical protein [Variovorax sp.]TAJ62442.1 MAG: hypothetical protein EPO53_18830 [Variovorax sp.]
MRALALNLLLALALPLAHAANDADTVGTYLTPGMEREELAQRFTGRNAVVIASVTTYIEPMCNPDSLPPKGSRIQELTFLDDQGKTLRIRIPRTDAEWAAKAAAQPTIPKQTAYAHLPVAYVIPSGRYTLQSHTIEAGMSAHRAPASGWSDGYPEVVPADGLLENRVFVAEAGKPVYIGHFHQACGIGSKSVPPMYADGMYEKSGTTGVVDPRYPSLEEVVNQRYPSLDLAQLVRRPIRQGPSLGMEPRRGK